MYLAIILLPFLGAAFAGLRGRAIGTTGAQIVTTGCITLTAILAMVAFYEVGLSGSPVSVELSSWLDAEPLHVSWAFLFDDLTVSMFNKDSSAMFIIPIFIKGTHWFSITKPKHVFPVTNCTDIVVWNNPYTIGTLIGYRVSTFIRAFTGLPSYHLSVLVGIILGDGHINKYSHTSPSARIMFSQSFKNFPYLWFVWTILSPLCSLVPYVQFKIKNGRSFMTVIIQTRAYKVLNDLYNIFVINGIKIVPFNIYDLLNDIALAHWIMCDGSRQRRGLVLCTDNFSNYDVARLMNVLLIKYDIKSRMHFNNKMPRIYIPGSEINKVKTLVMPHMCTFSLYKLGI